MTNTNTDNKKQHLIINYKRLIQAQDYYTSIGYQDYPVPWTVPTEISNLTKPSTRRNLHSFDSTQVHVASGEQSFMQLMVNKNLPYGSYQGITPCHRDEETLDDTHLNHFMKLELFIYLDPEDHDVNYDEILQDTIRDAFLFFSMHTKPVITYVDTDMFDIDDYLTGIELGSYGIRTIDYQDKKYTYIYGTGLSEPRLSIALSKNI